MQHEKHDREGCERPQEEKIETAEEKKNEDVPKEGDMENDDEKEPAVFITAE